MTHDKLQQIQKKLAAAPRLISRIHDLDARGLTADDDQIVRIVDEITTTIHQLADILDDIEDYDALLALADDDEGADWATGLRQVLKYGQSSPANPAGAPIPARYPALMSIEEKQAQALDDAYYQAGLLRQAAETTSARTPEDERVRMAYFAMWLSLFALVLAKLVSAVIHYQQNHLPMALPLLAVAAMLVMLAVSVWALRGPPDW
jgi:hypothetical protein